MSIGELSLRVHIPVGRGREAGIRLLDEGHRQRVREVSGKKEGKEHVRIQLGTQTYNFTNNRMTCAQERTKSSLDKGQVAEST